VQRHSVRGQSVVNTHPNPYFQNQPISQLGYQHGKSAKEAVSRSIDFYAKLFHTTSKRDWPQVLETAAEFEPHVKQKWPNFHAEIQGKIHIQPHNAPPPQTYSKPT